MKRQAEARVEALEPRLEPGVFSASKPTHCLPSSIPPRLPGSQAPSGSVGRGDVLLRAQGRILLCSKLPPVPNPAAGRMLESCLC